MLKFVDLHCDSIMNLYQGKHLKGMEGTHISLEKLQKGGSLAQCFAIFVPTNRVAERMQLKDNPTEYFDHAYEAYLRELELNKDAILPAYSVADVLRNDADGKLSSILTVEDSVTLYGDIAKLDDYYARGVRMATLTWNFENSLGYPQNRDPELHKLGLKPFGIEAVKRMNELGIAVDVSHLSEGGFWDVIRYSSKPVIASHSCAAGITPISRNLTDEQITALAKTGGVIGVNFANDFLHPVADRKTDRLTTIELLMANVRYMVNLAGIESIAMGSDYDGISSELEWGGADGNQRIAEALIKEYGEHDAKLICSENALRALRDNIGE